MGIVALGAVGVQLQVGKVGWWAPGAPTAERM